MKKILQILLPIIIFFIVGYLLGVYCPLDFFSCNISNEPITKGDYYGNIINFFGAFGTCLAVVVALFMDEIRSNFKTVDFEITLCSDEIVEEVEVTKKMTKAKRYYNSIQIFNKGNIIAQNCELYIENATITTTSGVIKELNFENGPISWNSNNNVYIPCQGKKVLQFLEMTSAQKQSTPDGGKETIPITLKILGMNDVEEKQGKWELIYSLYSTSSNPKRFKYTIDWNGNWEDRQKEMKNNLKVDLKLL